MAQYTLITTFLCGLSRIGEKEDAGLCSTFRLSLGHGVVTRQLVHELNGK